MKTEQRIKIYSAVISGLFILTAGTSAYFYKVSSENEKMNMELSDEKEALMFEKGLLSGQLENLQREFEETVAENSELKGNVSAIETMLQDKDNQLKKLKKQSGSDKNTIESLRSEVAEMHKVKERLEGEIMALKSENLALRNENNLLNAELRVAKKENATLSNRISDLTVLAQNTNLPGGLKTSAFRVEVEKRNDKLTVKGKKAKELAISFDMMDVPADMQGVQKFYLSVSDNKGTPVGAKSSSPVKVGMDGNTKEVIVHQMKEINIVQGQRLSFNYPLNDKLMPGTYRAAIYTKDGWIGSVGFRVS